MKKNILIIILTFLVVLLSSKIYNDTDESKEYKWYENNATDLQVDKSYSSLVNTHTQQITIPSYKSKFLIKNSNTVDVGYVVNLSFPEPIPIDDVAAYIELMIAIKDNDGFDLVPPIKSKKHLIFKEKNLVVQDRLHINFPKEKTNRVEKIKITELIISSTRTEYETIPRN